MSWVAPRLTVPVCFLGVVFFLYSFTACSHNPDADFQQPALFSGWNVEDFKQLRETVAGSKELLPPLFELVSMAKPQGWCADTTFRFATPEDAAALHRLNLVNDNVR